MELTNADAIFREQRGEEVLYDEARTAMLEAISLWTIVWASYWGSGAGDKLVCADGKTPLPCVADGFQTLTKLREAVAECDKREMLKQMIVWNANIEAVIEEVRERKWNNVDVVEALQKSVQIIYWGFQLENANEDLAENIANIHSPMIRKANGNNS